MPITKAQLKALRLREILRAFGEGRLIASPEQFWRYCEQNEITEQDIDAWCDENCAWRPDDEANSGKEEVNEPSRQPRGLRRRG
jgi:hypothetical protein